MIFHKNGEKILKNYWSLRDLSPGCLCDKQITQSFYFESLEYL